jgi:hypothetical protein
MIDVADVARCPKATGVIRYNQDGSEEVSPQQPPEIRSITMHTIALITIAVALYVALSMVRWRNIIAFDRRYGGFDPTDAAVRRGD